MVQHSLLTSPVEQSHSRTAIAIAPRNMFLQTTHIAFYCRPPSRYFAVASGSNSFCSSSYIDSKLMHLFEL